MNVFAVRVALSVVVRTHCVALCVVCADQVARESVDKAHASPVQMRYSMHICSAYVSPWNVVKCRELFETRSQRVYAFERADEM